MSGARVGSVNRSAPRLRRRVAVVGAGVVGLAVALQLRRAGLRDVVVVDALEAPGLGSTSRANGGVRAQWSTRVNIEFARFTIEGLRELDRQSGGLVGLRQVGYLFLAGTDAMEEHLHRNVELQRSLGVPVELLSPDGALARAPFIEPAGLRAGSFCPTDGVLDPNGVVAALWAAGRELDVEYRFDSAVTALEPVGEGIALRCGEQRLEADLVVNAAGAYAAKVAALAGVELPVQPYRRNQACTEPVSGYPDPIPMCVDLDTGVLIRREAGGFLIGYSDPNDAPTFETSFAPAFLEAIAVRVGNRFPFLETIPIDDRKCWAGLYPETPDHHAIVDRSPDVPALVHCVGFGGHGIMHSLACGQAVAELVRDGVCTSFDLRPLRLARFQEGDLTVESAVL